jgi:prepilin-type N-terminal cleavage/methylation domain-containing protein
VTRTQHEAGFSLVEVMVVVGVVGLMAGIAIPEITAGMRRYAVTSASQQIASAIRTARFQAVSQNRAMRIRFNCPTTGQYRIVEVTGGAADTAGNRCDTAAYPYPDTDPAARPNLDGPVQQLPGGTQITSTNDLQFDTSGRALPLTGCPTCATGAAPASIVVGSSYGTRTLSVSGNGQVVLP